MRRFIITSPKFTGTVELIYGENTLLAVADFSKASLDGVQALGMVLRLQKAVAVTSVEFFIEGTNATMVEADFEVSLNDFKREYPYSRNFHLLDAIWSKMNKTDQVQAYFAAIEYRKYCDKNGIRPPFIKISASWINNKEYKNDWRKM